MGPTELIERDGYFVHPTSIVENGCSIGQGTRIWHFCHAMGDSTIGSDCNIGHNVVVMPHVRIGNGVKIQNNVSLYTGVECADDVFIGPSVVFTNVLNPRSFVCRRDKYAPTRVRRGASLGANATIVCGVEIGEYALVGAGAVVVKDVKPFALVVGNPARQIGWVSRYGNRLIFNDNGEAECPETHERYLLKDGQVQMVSE